MAPKSDQTCSKKTCQRDMVPSWMRVTAQAGVSCGSACRALGWRAAAPRTCPRGASEGQVPGAGGEWEQGVEREQSPSLG